MPFFTHIDLLEVLIVFQVNFPSKINRVDTVEEDGKGGAAPDKADEEDDVQAVVLEINVHVDTQHLQAIVNINLPELTPIKTLMARRAKAVVASGERSGCLLLNRLMAMKMASRYMYVVSNWKFTLVGQRW